MDGEAGGDASLHRRRDDGVRALINCLSPMRAVYQFGLCGGVLVMLNFGIVLVYTPALLVLHEARVIYDPSATVGSLD